MYSIQKKFINDSLLDFYSCMSQFQELVLSICELLNLQKIAYVVPRYYTPKYFNETYVDFSSQTKEVSEKLAVYVFGDLFYKKYMDAMKKTECFTFNGLFLLRMEMFDKNNNKALYINFIFSNDHIPGSITINFADDFFSERKITNLWDQLYAQKNHHSMVLFSHKINQKIASMLKSKITSEKTFGFRFNLKIKRLEPYLIKKAFKHIYIRKNDEYIEFGVKKNIFMNELDAETINELVAMYDIIINIPNE